MIFFVFFGFVIEILQITMQNITTYVIMFCLKASMFVRRTRGKSKCNKLDVQVRKHGLVAMDIPDNMRAPVGENAL
jgi:hypothetical protein